MCPWTSANLDCATVTACALDNPLKVLESASVNHGANVHRWHETIVRLGQCATKPQLFCSLNDEAVDLVVLRGMHDETFDTNAILSRVLAIRTSVGRARSVSHRLTINRASIRWHTAGYL